MFDDIVTTLKIRVDMYEASELVEGGRVQSEISATGVVIYERTRYSTSHKNP